MRGGRRPGAGRKPGGRGGRPRGVLSQAKRELMELAKGAGPTALAALAEIAENEAAPPAARVSAAVAILDRGYGKPTQMHLNEPAAMKKAADMTDDELAQS